MVRKETAFIIPTDLINELLRLFTLDSSNRGHFLVVEQDSVKLVRRHQHLWTEGGRNKLCTIGQRLDHC